MINLHQDQTKFIADDFEAFSESPGFPLIRFNPIIENEEISSLSDDEQLLFLMHCEKGRLLLVSNKRIVIYKIPKKKSFLRNSLELGAEFTVGFIPGVGELMDAKDIVKDPIVAFYGMGKWLSGHTRRQRIKKEKEGLPAKRDWKDLKWNLKKPEILALVLSYREKILLLNGFHWKVLYEISYEQEADKSILIILMKDLINFQTERKGFSINMKQSEFDFINYFSSLMDKYRKYLENAKWSIAEKDDKLILRYGENKNLHDSFLDLLSSTEITIR